MPFAAFGDETVDPRRDSSLIQSPAAGAALGLAGQGGVFLVEVPARLRPSCVGFLRVGVGNVRLEDLPPAVVQLRAFFSAETGPDLRDVPLLDRGSLPTWISLY